jgi:hypothetical protein
VSDMVLVVTLALPGCLPEAEPVVVDSVREAAEYVRGEVDRMVDEMYDSMVDENERAEWDAALAHAESFLDYAGDVPRVPLPDGYIFTTDVLSP